MFGTDAAARCWWELIKSLSTHGYKGTNFSHSVYTLRKGEDTIIMWVDACDGIATASSEQALRTLESLIKKSLEVDWHIRSPQVLDATIEKVSGGCSLCQCELVDEIVRENWDGTSLAQNPLPEGFSPSTFGQSSEKHPSEYRSLVRRLAAIATKTRPDMVYSVLSLAQFSQEPTVEHWSGLTHLVCYLARTRKITLNLLPCDSGSEALHCYSDASWTGPRVAATHGFVVRLYECPVYCVSRKLFSLADAASEAEQMAFDQALKHALWIRDLVENLVGMRFKIRIHCDKDCTGKVLSERNPSTQMGSFRHPTIQAGHASISWIAHRDQVANTLTHQLSNQSHEILARKVQGPSALR
ncbi:hypothetical protein Pst134EA_033367 [Puccinia striiformis f. sp. tritici]|uniref:hypothetical protein n=1 Tax=Puccinia striiformis f. sp. tritici TaxID=168172 RepID=UPI002008A7D1|nr:hypothetical protein Pst134EA_033367 [Puccinia striiformis f. sp. tritici]KAH9468572.1 hypothetical protein Pst134EA_033367 [Puccinia striiformis f. sp. tritici]